MLASMLAKSGKCLRFRELLFGNSGIRFRTIQHDSELYAPQRRFTTSSSCAPLFFLLILPRSHPLCSAVLVAVVFVHPPIPFLPRTHRVRLVRPHSEQSVPVPTLAPTPIPKPPSPLFHLPSPTSPVPCTKRLSKLSPVFLCHACRHRIRIQTTLTTSTRPLD